MIGNEDRQSLPKRLKGRDPSSRLVVFVAPRSSDSPDNWEFRMSSICADRQPDCHLSLRLEEVVTQFRLRLEQHFDQQSRMQQSYLGAQNSWSAQCVQMTRQLNVLEGLLGAWMSHRADAPRFAVVGESTDVEA